MLQLPQTPAGAACRSKAILPTAPTTPDVADPIFGKMPLGFDLAKQPIPMLVYWLGKARARVDAVMALDPDDSTDEAMTDALEPFNRIFDALVNAETSSASDVEFQMRGIIGYLDWFKTDNIEEAITADQFRKIAANLKRATAFKAPNKYPGKLARGRKLTRAGLLFRYHAFLMGELRMLSWNMYGSRDYAFFFEPVDLAVTQQTSQSFRKGKYVQSGRKTDPFFDESKLTNRARAVLKSLKIDTEKEVSR